MAQRITAIFYSQVNSSDAEARLRAEGFSARRQRLDASLENAIPQDDLGDVDGGQWMVTVEAPFGGAKRAIALLTKFDPETIQENDQNRARSRMMSSHHATNSDGDADVIRSPDHSFFVSTLLGIPLLINCPAPLSSLLGLPTLIRQ